MFGIFVLLTFVAISLTASTDLATCPPHDDAGGALNSSASGQFLGCTYQEAGFCTYFAIQGGLASGSDVCPDAALPASNSSGSTSGWDAPFILQCVPRINRASRVNGHATGSASAQGKSKTGAISIAGLSQPLLIALVVIVAVVLIVTLIVVIMCVRRRRQRKSRLREIFDTSRNPQEISLPLTRNPLGYYEHSDFELKSQFDD
ncbi:hypothetical protein C8R46DRAFT_1192072 [Mycena filopes]|nr:hypothetical protein C8R46DRAFT_1192072 [Mycena filopes]